MLEFCLALNAAFLSLTQVPQEHCITAKSLISTLHRVGWGGGGGGGGGGVFCLGCFYTCSSLSLVQPLVPEAQLCCNHSRLLHHLHGGLWQRKSRK